MESLETRTLLTSYVVDSPLDTIDANDGQTTLREAIEQANAHAGHDTITFQLSGTGPQTIALASVLPTVTDQITIDGSTQPGITIDASGVAGNVLRLGSNADGSTLQQFAISNAIDTAVQLVGVMNASIDGLDLSYVGSISSGTGLSLNSSDNNTVRNVIATHRENGISLAHSNNNIVEQNDVSQAGSTGIQLIGASNANLIQQNDASGSQEGINAFVTGGFGNQFVDNDLSDVGSWGLTIRNDSQFVSLGNDFSNSSNGAWLGFMNGITLAPSATFDIDVSTVTGTGLALVSVTNSTIEGLDLSYTGSGTSGTGLQLFGSDDNQVRHVTATSRSRGIQLNSADGNLIEQNTVRQSGHAGIAIAGNSNANVFQQNDASESVQGIQYLANGLGNQYLDNDLSHTTGWGLFLRNDNQFVVTGNDFTESGQGVSLLFMDGITLAPSATFDLDVSTVTGVGLNLVSISNSTIDGLDLSYAGSGASGTGLKLFNSDHNILSDLTVGNRENGIQLTSSDQIQISCSRLTENESGMRVDGTTSDTMIVDSQIEGNVTGLQNVTANIVLAENNYWGAADGPANLGGSGDSYFGNVDADPFLTSLPDCLVEVQSVEIDVKPDSEIDTVNLASRGVLPVVIYSTADFDAATVDVGTVTFAGAVVAQSALEDVDGDGDLDLVLHFRIQEMVDLEAGYLEELEADLADNGVVDDNHQNVSVTLEGQTSEGLQIEGTDTIDAFFAGKAFRDALNSI